MSLDVRPGRRPAGAKSHSPMGSEAAEAGTEAEPPPGDGGAVTVDRHCGEDAVRLG